MQRHHVGVLSGGYVTAANDATKAIRICGGGVRNGKTAKILHEGTAFDIDTEVTA